MFETLIIFSHTESRLDWWELEIWNRRQSDQTTILSHVIRV